VSYFFIFIRPRKAEFPRLWLFSASESPFLWGFWAKFEQIREKLHLGFRTL